jgi:hypothetical protein
MGNKKENFEVIEVPASGKRDWFGGAWCLVWVYSKSGNFLLKGYRNECEDYIKSKGWSCWAIYNLYGRYGHRTVLLTYNCDFEISNPSRMSKKKTSEDFKYKIYRKGNYRGAINVKRLPKVFVNFNPPYENVVPNSLGSMDALKSLRDNMDQNNR